MVSMCPYKWALYALSVWAALYVLLEVAMAWRDAGDAGAGGKPGYEPGPVGGEEGEDLDDEDESDFGAEKRPGVSAAAGHPRD